MSDAPKPERIRYAVTQFDHESHWAFVRSSWCRGARQSPEALLRRLRRPETRCLVAHEPGNTDALLGWVAVDTSTTQPALIWIFVRRLYDRMRGRGLGSALLTEAGIDLNESIAALFWSPHASAIAARGSWLLFFAPYGTKRAA